MEYLERMPKCLQLLVSTMVPYKQWCHVALVRDSGTIKLFVDGKQDAQPYQVTPLIMQLLMLP